MFLFHYILPFIIFYFFRKKIVLYGLLLGNLIDLDHVYFRIIGKVGWSQSACPHLGMECSWNFYPLHNLTFAVIFLLLSSLIFVKNKKIKFIGWIFLGAFIHLFLDYFMLITGIGF